LLSYLSSPQYLSSLTSHLTSLVDGEGSVVEGGVAEGSVVDGGASLENTTVSGDGDGSAVSAPADGEVAEVIITSNP
jgi:hypothetical protein